MRRLTAEKTHRINGPEDTSAANEFESDWTNTHKVDLVLISRMTHILDGVTNAPLAADDRRKMERTCGWDEDVRKGPGKKKEERSLEKIRKGGIRRERNKPEEE